MFFVENGQFFCSYCKKPIDMKFSDLRPLDMVKEEDKKLVKKVLQKVKVAGGTNDEY